MWKKCNQFEKFLIIIACIITIVCYVGAVIAFFEQNYLYVLGMLLGMLGGILLNVIVSDDNRKFNRAINATKLRPMK